MTIVTPRFASSKLNVPGSKRSRQTLAKYLYGATQPVQFLEEGEFYFTSVLFSILVILSCRSFYPSRPNDCPKSPRPVFEIEGYVRACKIQSLRKGLFGPAGLETTVRNEASLFGGSRT